MATRLWQVGNSTGTSSASTITQAGGGTVAIGDVIVVDFTFGTNSGAIGLGGTPCADGLSNVYTQVGSIADGGNGQASAQYRTIVTNAGTPSFTASFSGATTFRGIIATAYRPGAGASFTYDNGGGAGPTATATPAVSFLTTGASGFIHGACWDTGSLSAIPTTGAGFTAGMSVGDGSSTVAGATEWKTITAGSNNATFALAGGPANLTFGVAFVESGGAPSAGGIVPRPMFRNVPTDARYRAQMNLAAYSTDLPVIPLVSTIYCRRTFDVGAVSGVGSRRAIH